ncbi:MAG: ABC transporter permease [Chloroflexi bacterium]|nr:ABC transporter permease [Chloroflexota bacterium]
MRKIFALAGNFVRLSLRSCALAAAILKAIDGSSVIRRYQSTADEPLPTDKAVALAKLDDYNRLLFLPAGLSATLLTGQAVNGEFYVTDRDESTRAAQAEISAIFTEVSGAIQTANLATKLAASLQPFANAREQTAYFDQALASAQRQQTERTVTIRREIAVAAGGAATQLANGTNQSSPGSLVNFGLINLLSCAIVFVNERVNGTLRRLVTSPISKFTLLTGKIVGPILMGILQALLLIGVGQWVFGVAWGRSPLALAVVTLTFILAGVSMGIFISTLVRTGDQAVSLMIGASMLMAALGGAWWPLEITPRFMQQIGHLFPSAWAMDGFQSVILRGAGVAEVTQPVLVLLGFATVFFVLGIWRFRYE